jgi:cell division protein FtsW
MPPRTKRRKRATVHRERTPKGHQIDHLLLITVLALLIFGLIMIASIGVPKSIHLSAPDMLYPNCGSDDVDCYLILKNHSIRLIIGLLVFLGALKIHYSFWRKMSLPFFALAFGLLMMVLFFGSDHNTFARSWLSISSIPFLQSVQPTEIAKLALIFYFGTWLDRKQRDNEINTFQGGFLAFCVVSLLLIGPVIFQPDLGSTLVLASIAAGMYFIAGADWKHILLGVTIASFLAIITVSNSDYLGNRFSAFLSPTVECAEDYCWQSEQSKIAVGSGGVWGRGLTQGIQKSYWLPQASDDFIFAASAEEIGFIRVVFVIMAYSVIMYKGFQIANYAPDPFARLTAAGITLWISAQSFINIMVNIALFPVTGITLPFVSYGGSSMVMTLAAVGVLLNISKYTTHRAYTPQWRRNSRPRLTPYRRR